MTQVEKEGSFLFVEMNKWGINSNNKKEPKLSVPFGYDQPEVDFGDFHTSTEEF